MRSRQLGLRVSIRMETPTASYEYNLPLVVRTYAVWPCTRNPSYHLFASNLMSSRLLPVMAAPPCSRASTTIASYRTSLNAVTWASIPSTEVSSLNLLSASPPQSVQLVPSASLQSAISAQTSRMPSVYLSLERSSGTQMTQSISANGVQPCKPCGACARLHFPTWCGWGSLLARAEHQPCQSHVRPRP